MNNKALLVALVAALLITGACGASSNNANNANNTNRATTTTTTTNTTSTTNSAANNSAASNTAPTNSANNSASNTAEGKQDFTLVNATGVEINALYVSPHDKNDWEEDILGQDTLANGQSLEIKFHRDEKAAMWDLRVEDKGGNSIEWENLNLLEISKITLHYKDGKATAVTE
ncbi:MAG TPA: hypothetical protein VGB17_14625 [Pyrinomonadaceae bacterium]|jgi:hypothetical protein